MRHVDITNKRYGKLTAIKRVDDYVSPKGQKREKWLFKCDCGKTIIRIKNLVVRGECNSCGCEKSNRMIEYNKTSKIKHGLHKTRLYRIWSGIKTRCFNENNEAYHLYGGRGISVCNEWRFDFKTFYEWSINNGYGDTLTIDRINFDSDYEPSNCRWVDMKTQSRNKRTNLLFELNGETRCLSEWAELYGFDAKLERYRIKKEKEYLECLIMK